MVVSREIKPYDSKTCSIIITVETLEIRRLDRNESEFHFHVKNIRVGL